MIGHHKKVEGRFKLHPCLVAWVLNRQPSCKTISLIRPHRKVSIGKGVERAVRVEMGITPVNLLFIRLGRRRQHRSQQDQQWFFSHEFPLGSGTKLVPLPDWLLLIKERNYGIFRIIAVDADRL